MVSSIKASCLDSATCLFNGIECCDKKLHYVTFKCITLDFIIQKFVEELKPILLNLLTDMGTVLAIFL